MGTAKAEGRPGQFAVQSHTLCSPTGKEGQVIAEGVQTSTTNLGTHALAEDGLNEVYQVRVVASSVWFIIREGINFTVDDPGLAPRGGVVSRPQWCQSDGMHKLIVVPSTKARQGTHQGMAQALKQEGWRPSAERPWSPRDGNRTWR